MPSWHAGWAMGISGPKHRFPSGRPESHPRGTTLCSCPDLLRKTLTHPGFATGHGCRQRLDIGAPAHGHVGTTTALATNLSGNLADQFARLDPIGLIGRDTGHEADLAVAHRGQQHHGGLELVLELVD